MITNMKDSMKAIVFTAIVFLLAVSFSLIPGMSTFVYMFTPTIAVLIMMLVVTRDGYKKEGWKRLGLHKLGMKGWPFAIIIPAIPLILSYLIVWGTGLASIEPGADFEGFSWSYLPLLFVFLLIKSTLLESMGEELGWRGYLLPLMVNAMSPKKAMLLNGFIHGTWHFPLMVIAGLYHADEALWIILPMAVLSTIFLAPVIGQLRMRSGSVWTASLMHTAHNLVWLILNYITVNNNDAAPYISGDMGLVVIVFYVALTYFMWRRTSKNHSVRQSA